MHKPLNINLNIPTDDHPGSFGIKRKYDIHTGIDLYCQNNDDVFAIEDGEVIDVIKFTGFEESPWWNDTYAVIVKSSKSSNIWLYGEIDNIQVQKGQNIASGSLLGHIKTVLKKNKGKPMSMLHIELYSSYKEAVVWKIDTEMPEGLEDPTEILKKIFK